MKLMQTVPVWRRAFCWLGIHRWVEQSWIPSLIGPDVVFYECYWCGIKTMDLE